MAGLTLTTLQRGNEQPTPAFEPGLVSVIIPNYNNAHYLPEAIDSVLAQTYRNYEIIVVDDGSTDDSRAVAARYGSRITYIWQENRGLAGARNTGIRAARGEFLGLLDADDQWMPDYLATMINLSRQDPDAAVYYCSVRCMDAHGIDYPRTMGNPVAPPEETYHLLLRFNFIIPSTVMMRHQVVLDAGAFDDALRSCEDWDLWLRVAPAYRFNGLDMPLVRYRLHTASLSADLSGMHRAVRAMVQKNFGPEAGAPEGWPPAKRRAYGGLYRYYTLTSVQRAGDWAAAAGYLQQALLADPTLATDLDLFYDLALGTQPPGVRGSAQQLDLVGNGNHVDRIFGEMAGKPAFVANPRLWRSAYGTALFALGLAAYNTGQHRLSRDFLRRAAARQPELWRNSRWLGSLARATLGQQEVVVQLKKLRKSSSHVS